MKRTGLTMAAALALLMACAGGKEADMAAFMLKSEAFADGATLPAQFTCDGEDQSPPLSWSEPPQGTKSFALVVDDPDAPSGTFRHWGAFNIPASTRGLPAGAGNETAGDVAQARNDFGRPGYGGACPPKGHGPHHYRFKLFALDTDKLDLPPEAKIEQMEAVAATHLLGQAELTGTYQRN
jgi:Raf kinase inhibitor-like YbhB/YbcL family protein